MPSRDVSALVQAINGGRKPPAIRLSLDHWTIAFDIYAVASAAVGSWSYAAARNHKVVFSFLVVRLSFLHLSFLLQVTCQRMGQRSAGAGGNAYMAVLYDEAARKAFHRRSLAGDDTFDIEVEVTKMSEEIWLDAEAASKSRHGNNGQSRPPADHWQQQHKGSGKGQKSKDKSRSSNWQMPTNLWKQARPLLVPLMLPVASCLCSLACQDKGQSKGKAAQHHAGNVGQAKGTSKAAQK